MDGHSCQAIVVTCMDFRLQEYINNWLGQKFAPKTFDRVAYAGGVKSLSVILGQIDLSVKLHHIKKAVFVNHEDCGAYGAAGTPEKHAQDLKNSREKIKEIYPDLDVELYYLKLDGSFEEVS